MKDSVAYIERIPTIKIFCFFKAVLYPIQMVNSVFETPITWTKQQFKQSINLKNQPSSSSILEIPSILCDRDNNKTHFQGS